MVRTLPIRVGPWVGESLESWLEAYAARMSICWGDLLDAVGLVDDGGAPGAADEPHRFSKISAQQSISLTEATGIAC